MFTIAHHTRRLLAAGLLSLGLLGTQTAHAQTPATAPSRYRAHVTGGHVSAKGITHYKDGTIAYDYDVTLGQVAGSYTVYTGYHSRGAAQADSALNFGSWRKTLAQGRSAQHAGVWSVLERETAVSFCPAAAGAYWHRIDFEVLTTADDCAAARSAAVALFQGVSTVVGRHSPAGIPWAAHAAMAAPTAAASATAIPVPPVSAATHDGVTVTASNLHQDSGGDFSAPPAGQQYAVVRVVLTNQGTQSASYNALDFKLEGADDHIRYDGDAFDTNISNTSLSSGNIAPGETVAGDVAFQVPANEDRFILLWTPNFLGDSIPVPIR